MDLENIILKACPFCGSTSTPVLTTNLDLGLCDNTEAFGFTVNCDGGKGGCGTTCGFYETPEEVIELWNRTKIKPSATNVTLEEARIMGEKGSPYVEEERLLSFTSERHRPSGR